MKASAFPPPPPPRLVKRLPDTTPLVTLARESGPMRAHQAAQFQAAPAPAVQHQKVQVHAYPLLQRTPAPAVDQRRQGPPLALNYPAGPVLIHPAPYENNQVTTGAPNQHQGYPMPLPIYRPLHGFSHVLQRVCSPDQFVTVQGPEMTGSYGRVYPVRDQISGQLFAIKRIVHHHSVRDHAFINSEETIHYPLNHPNIARFHCTMVDSFNGDVLFLLDYVHGRDLRNYMAELGGPVPPAIVTKVIEKVALALRYMHQQGFAHRDIKPENIMISSNQEIKVIDFGLASPSFADDLVNCVGTAGYQAPEVMAIAYGGLPYGRASDYYSLGVVAYLLHTSRELFPETDVAKCWQRLNGAMPVNMCFTNDAPMEEVLQRLLLRDPKIRWRYLYDDFAFFQRLRLFYGLNWAPLGYLELPDVPARRVPQAKTTSMRPNIPGLP